LRFEFGAGHPLAALRGEVPAEFEVTDGFDVVVGRSVELA
jgi:hypothetical protein